MEVYTYLSTYLVLYIHVTVHRNRFLFNNQPGALIIQIYSVIKLYMFRASSHPDSAWTRSSKPT